MEELQDDKMKPIIEAYKEMNSLRHLMTEAEEKEFNLL